MGNENNRFSVIVSVKATKMLTEHARFLANVSEEAARNFIDEYKLAARSLESFPERNPWLADQTLPIKKYRKLIFYKKYMLIYQIRSERVYLDYVLDCRQDYKWLL